MGVFSLFRRKAKGAEETAETATATAAATEAKGADQTEDEARPEGEAKDTVTDAETEETGTADEVEIPKQQTAGQAADNETSEGARK